MFPSMCVNEDERVPVMLLELLEQHEQRFHLASIREPALVVELDERHVIVGNTGFHAAVALLVLVAVVPMLDGVRCGAFFLASRNGRFVPAGEAVDSLIHY